MDSTQDFVDIAFLQSELESFVRNVEADASVEAAQLLSQAEALLSKVLTAWRESRDRSEPVGDDADGAWHATIASDESGERDVLVFRGRQGDDITEAVLEGTWGASAGSAATLRLLTVQIGDRAWGMRETEHGRSLFDTDGNVVGPGDAKLVAELSQPARQRLPDLKQPQSLVVGWVCSGCHWPNRAEATLCQLCRRAKGAAPSTATPASSLFGGAEFEGLPPELTPSLSLTGARSSIPELLEPTLEQTPIGKLLTGKVPVGRAASSGTADGAAKSRSRKFCTSCGAEIKRPGQKFCGACGAGIPASR